MILILKFLMKEVFAAGEGSVVALFNTANVLFSKMGSMNHGVDVERLIPR